MADEQKTPEANEVKVDESSINPPNAARRNSLEKLISHRPDRTELIESKRPLTN